jgi:hypothetical protein
VKVELKGMNGVDSGYSTEKYDKAEEDGSTATQAESVFFPCSSQVATMKNGRRIQGASSPSPIR